MKIRTKAGDDALTELADVIGAQFAQELCKRFGGTRIYVPRRIGEHHPIYVALGCEGAAALAAYAGGGDIDVPMQAARRERVIALYSKGTLTRGQIALETSYSERHVYRLIRDSVDEAQPSLFDGL